MSVTNCASRVLPFYEAHDLPVLRILTDRGTEYCGRTETHDCQLFLAINDIDHTKRRHTHRRPMESASASTRQSYRSSTRLRFARSSMAILMSCNPIWTNGLNTTIMNVRIRARYAAGERQCRRYMMANKSGRRSSWFELELTVTTIEPGNCQIKSELLQLLAGGSITYKLNLRDSTDVWNNRNYFK